MLLFGCDFSSAPSRRKPIVIAIGALAEHGVSVHELKEFASLDDWGQWLAKTPSWVGAFDFPFGLPRELVEQLGWPREWEALITYYAGLDRDAIRAEFAAFCAARPVGGKFAHRAVDRPAGSSPSMKWVNPPVAFMLHAGVPRLLAAGATLPGLHEGPDRRRIALEAYPGVWARRAIGRRSYKSDAASSQSQDRAAARADLLAAMEFGLPDWQVRLHIHAELRTEVLADGQGDRVDALLCLMQAAWAARRADTKGPGYGLPCDTDPLEGWIIGV